MPNLNDYKKIHVITPSVADEWWFRQHHPEGLACSEYLRLRGIITHTVVARALEEVRKTGKLDVPAAVAQYFDANPRLKRGLDEIQVFTIRSYLLDCLWNVLSILFERLNVQLLFVERQLETLPIPVLR